MTIDKQIDEILPFFKTEIGYDHPLFNEERIAKLKSDIKSLLKQVVLDVIGEMEPLLTPVEQGAWTSNGGDGHKENERRKMLNSIRLEQRDRLNKLLKEASC